MAKANPFNPDCPSQEILALIGSKWSMLLMCILREGPTRSCVLARRAAGISQKMLTQTLRSMEADGLVQRTVFDVVPPAVEYRLTPLGETLKAPLVAICTWAMEHLHEMQAARSSLSAT